MVTTATANNRAALEASQAITRRSASNLALAFVALDRRRRLAMSALYAFCRQIDDVADEEPHPREQRASTLQDWREDVQRACEGGEPRIQVNQALQPVIEQYALKFEHFDELIRGMEMDLEQDRFETLDDLDRYCYRAASVVGLLSIEIFGYCDDACQEYAVNLGKALQLTNILRDVGNDAGRGRIYMPVAEMKKYGVDPQSLLDLKYSAAFHNLAADIAVRARPLSVGIRSVTKCRPACYGCRRSHGRSVLALAAPDGGLQVSRARSASHTSWSPSQIDACLRNMVAHQNRIHSAELWL